MQINRQCFRCEKFLRSTSPEDDNYDFGPENATAWSTVGNYGSSVFDGGEFTGTMLELFICDECLDSRRELVFLYRKERQPPKVIEFKKFSEE